MWEQKNLSQAAANGMQGDSWHELSTHKPGHENMQASSAHVWLEL